MNVPRRVLAARCALGGAAAITAGLASYLTFFGLAQIFDNATALLVASGASAFLFSSLCAGLGSQLLRAGFGVRAALCIGTLAVGAVALFARFTILDPLVASLTPADVAVRHSARGNLWTLPTGSRLAHLDFPAVSPKRGTIVFLHGGPGAYSVSLKPTTQVIARLREDGYDVYFYDQIGSGLSPRLSDPSQYTVERHIADLEAIRLLLRAKRLILIGSSWGATLAAHYMRRYPDAVAATIFSGPGVIYPGDWTTNSYGRAEEALSESDRNQLDQHMDNPRLTTAMKLLAHNPQLARSFLPDDEADRFFDSVLDRYLLQVVTAPNSPVRVSSDGYGFWSNSITSRNLDAAPDPRPALRQNRTPILVLRGRDEYMKPDVAADYATTFALSTFVEIENAGHMIYWDQPEMFLTQARMFLGRDEVQQRL